MVGEPYVDDEGETVAAYECANAHVVYLDVNNKVMLINNDDEERYE